MPTHSFTLSEKAQCVIWNCEGYGWKAIQRKFRTKYQKRAPVYLTLRKWREEYETRGSHDHRGGNGRPNISEERKNDVRDLVKSNPRISLRQLTAQTGVPTTTVWRILRNELRLFPYKLQMGVELSDNDKQNRISFAQYCRAQLRENPGYLKRIVFSDECHFSLSGHVNSQNCRIWGSERPKQVYETLQGAPSVMVWCGITAKEIIGPYFFDNENVTGDSYKKMLRYFVFRKLANYPDDMLFQHDGAPAHYALQVREYLDRKLPNRWIGRAGPIAWPARSPDLTPCDYFLWGYLKDIVYQEPIPSLAVLKDRIRNAISTIGEETLIRVFENMESRLIMLERHNGGHFEHLYN